MNLTCLFKGHDLEHTGCIRYSGGHAYSILQCTRCPKRKDVKSPFLEGIKHDVWKDE